MFIGSVNAEYGDPGGRVVKGVVLRQLACWGLRVRISLVGHGSLPVVSVVFLRVEDSEKR